MQGLATLLCKCHMYLRGFTVRNGITHNTVIVDACRQTEVKAGRHYYFLILLLAAPVLARLWLSTPALQTTLQTAGLHAAFAQQECTGGAASAGIAIENIVLTGIQ